MQHRRRSHDDATTWHADRALLVVRGRVTGPRGTAVGRFGLDTGAAFTTITPELADLVGYGARDGIRRTRVCTAVGSEEGFLLEVAGLDVLGFARSQFRVHIFDLGYDDIDGLIGLNFLSVLNYEVRSAERRILVEAIGTGETRPDAFSDAAPVAGPLQLDRAALVDAIVLREVLARPRPRRF